MRQMKLRLKALNDTFQHANAQTTENKREVRVMELEDSIIFEELYYGVTSSQLDNIKKFGMFEDSFSSKITRDDERGSAELPKIYTEAEINEIKKQYKLVDEFNDSEL